MSYRDFELGITSKQLRHMREQEQAERLRWEMTSRWGESERILSVLRSIRAIPETATGIEEWFSRVKSFSSMRLDESCLLTPSGWFAARFPCEAQTYGRAFFEEMRTGMQASQAVLPHTINEDFFAAMLSGEKRLGHRMVHLPSEGFWFLDPKVGLFCPTTDQKVELLVSNYMVKCAEAMGGNVDSGPLLTVHRRSSVLSSIVKRARSVLEAEPRFFEGAGAPQRFLQGRILAPVASSSPAEFINRAIEPLQGGVVVVSEAYQGFLQHCQKENLARVGFSDFRKTARDLIMEKFQLGLRHDIRTPAGRQL
jgi:hypothetical protein